MGSSSYAFLKSGLFFSLRDFLIAVSALTHTIAIGTDWRLLCILKVIPISDLLARWAFPVWTTRPFTTLASLAPLAVSSGTAIGPLSASAATFAWVAARFFHICRFSRELLQLIHRSLIQHFWPRPRDFLAYTLRACTAGPFCCRRIGIVAL